MEEIVIVSAVRTAVGRLGGGLKDVEPDILGKIVIEEAIKRAGIEPGEVDEVITRPDQAERRRRQPGPRGRAPRGRAHRSAGLHRHASVWLGPAGHPQRRLPDHGRRGRHRGGRRRREHEQGPLLLAGRPLRLRRGQRRAGRLQHREPAAFATLRGLRQPDHGSHRREPGREVRHQPRGVRTSSRCRVRTGPSPPSSRAASRTRSSRCPSR